MCSIKIVDEMFPATIRRNIKETKHIIDLDNIYTHTNTRPSPPHREGRVCCVLHSRPPYEWYLSESRLLRSLRCTSVWVRRRLTECEKSSSLELECCPLTARLSVFRPQKRYSEQKTFILFINHKRIGLDGHIFLKK